MIREVVSEAMMLPAFPNRDPVDELIVATARIHQLTLLTAGRNAEELPACHDSLFCPDSGVMIKCAGTGICPCTEESLTLKVCRHRKVKETEFRSILAQSR